MQEYIYNRTLAWLTVFLLAVVNTECEPIGGVSVVVNLVFIITPIVGVCNCCMFYCTLLYVHSSSAIIMMGMRELVALLSLSFWCLVIVVWLFLASPWVCLQFMIVVFPVHTHLLFSCPMYMSHHEDVNWLHLV